MLIVIPYICEIEDIKIILDLLSASYGTTINHEKLNIFFSTLPLPSKSLFHIYNIAYAIYIASAIYRICDIEK